MMKRRDFLSAAVAAGGTMMALPAQGGVPQGAAGGPGPAREFYELRHYQLRRGPQTQLLDEYFSQAALPALQRAGIGPVGVFNVMIGPGSPALTVLIPHKTLDGFASLPARLAADAEYQRAGVSYLNAVATNPAFVRIETALMRAFDAVPAIVPPFGGGEAGKRPRIFELRTYESHSEQAAKKKIEMFNTGEIAIFRRAGLQPVFFGETLAGTDMPNLTYMLVYEDMAAHDRQWAAFSADPEWKKLSTTPGFTDPEIVANITNRYLRPTAYSQI